MNERLHELTSWEWSILSPWFPSPWLADECIGVARGAGWVIHTSGSVERTLAFCNDIVWYFVRDSGCWCSSVLGIKCRYVIHRRARGHTIISKDLTSVLNSTTFTHSGPETATATSSDSELVVIAFIESPDFQPGDWILILLCKLQRTIVRIIGFFDKRNSVFERLTNQGRLHSFGRELTF